MFAIGGKWFSKALKLSGIHGMEGRNTDLGRDGGSDVRVLGRDDGGRLGLRSVDTCC